MSSEKNNRSNMADEDFLQSHEAAEESGSGAENEQAAEAAEPDTEQLRQELDESRDKLLRLAAEFENYKKRMERDRETLVKYAGENIFRELLSTVDNLERALEQGSSESGDAAQKLDALLEGVQLTRKGLLSTLEKFDVVPLESVGREFDPNEHEAMSMEATDSVPPNHVSQEYVKGYRYKDRLLRPAKVIVAQE